MEDGDAPLGIADPHVAVGVIDGVDDVAVFQVVHQLGDGHFGAVVLGLLRRRAQMGNGDAAGHIGGLFIGEVGDIPGHLAAGQGLGHGVVVHQLIPGKVQDDDAVLHLGDGLGVDHLPSIVQQRGVQGDDVALGVDIRALFDPDDVAVQVPGGLDGDKGIAAVDVHAQPPGGIGQRAAYRAQADDAQVLMPDLMAGELGLALFHQPGDLGAALDGLHPVDAAHHVPAGQQHPAQGQLHDGVGVGAGGIEHHNALLRAGGQGDVVDPGSGPGHGQQPLRQLHFVHPGAAHQHGVRLIQVVRQGEILRPQGRALGGNLVQIVNIVHPASLLLIRFPSQSAP